MKLTGPTTVRFDDQTQELQRKNHEMRIVELQDIVSDLTSAGTVAAGRALGLPLELAGSGNTELPGGTTSIEIEMVGAGGGGGGGQGGLGVAPGGGGGSGVYLAFSLTISPTDLVVTWAAGSGGAGGSTAGGNGVTGGDTTLTVGGKTYTAKGGTGGVGGLNTALAAANAGGRPQSGSSPAPRVGGTEGDRGISVGGVFYGGSGGDNPMGVGGFTVDGNTAGVDALGPGGGGGGACATGTGLVGGNGLSGKILVWAKT